MQVALLLADTKQAEHTFPERLYVLTVTLPAYLSTLVQWKAIYDTKASAHKRAGGIGMAILTQVWGPIRAFAHRPPLICSLLTLIASLLDDSLATLAQPSSTPR